MTKDAFCSKSPWPYNVDYDKENEVSGDVLVIGGGMAGCFAAISAAKKGANVIVVDKASVKISGSGGTGVDHWHFACTNPCSRVSPDEMIETLKIYPYGISGETGMGPVSYITCMEGYDALLDLEKAGAVIRDVNDQFAGAEFRDENTKLMFAYDYDGRHTLPRPRLRIQAGTLQGTKTPGCKNIRSYHDLQSVNRRR